MDALYPSQPHILVVEANADVNDILCTALQEEGYTTSCVPSLDEALEALKTQSFPLILADLYAGKSRHSFTQAHILRRRVRPIPVGLLTTQNVSQEEARREGFAFLLQMPFDLDDLFANVASALHPVLTSEQQRQAEVVQRYFAILNERDWEAVAALCMDDVSFYPPLDSQFARTRRLTGSKVFCAYLAEATRHFTFRMRVESIFPRRRGLMALYEMHSLLPGSPTAQQSQGVALFHFQGEAISQIGIRPKRAGATELGQHAQAG
jgi:CheY-like chemotaxis protein